MQQHFFTRAAAVLAAGAMLVLGACSDQATSTSPLMAEGPSFVIVGDAVPNTPTNEVLTVCKVWVGVADADIDVTLSGDGSGTFTVPTATGTPPNTCRAVAIQGSTADATITVTEDDPGIGFTTTWTVDNLDNSLDDAGSGLSATTTIGGTGPKGAVITFTNTFTPPPPTGNQGCTPGYWKQPHHFDSWGDYSPGDDFDTVFGVDAFNPDITLLQALQLGGGGINALARHAVAALLNADQGFYPLTEAEVIAAVQAALSGGDIEGTKNTFEGHNELGCPLN